MKAQYTLKPTTNNINYIADLALINLTSEQLEFIRTLLHDATKHNALFDKADRDELSGQKVIDQIAVQLKN
jgi:hypothetical protein